MTATIPERTQPVPRVGDRVRHAGATGVVIHLLGDGLVRVAFEGALPRAVPAVVLERIG